VTPADTPVTGSNTQREHELPKTNSLFARFARTFLIPIVSLAYRVKVIGLEHIPDGPVVLAANHVSYVDPIVMWGRSPRFIHMVAKADLWDIPVVRSVLNGAGVIPVHRETVDRTFIQTATRLLDEGNPVGIFPEGTRHREPGLGEGNEGVAFIAMRANAPILPVGIAGTDKIMPDGTRLPRFPRVTMVVGEPLDPAELAEGSRKERVTALTQQVMEGIARELAVAERTSDEG
jgi:1-acyl-sn-glycerol-3-phosphate acyltransferase